MIRIIDEQYPTQIGEFITAKEAKEKTDKIVEEKQAYQKKMKPLLDSIVKAVNDGKWSCNFSTLDAEQISYLKDNGYKLDKQTGYGDGSLRLL